MFEQRKNLRGSISVAQIKEVYRDHPRMRRVNVFKETLKQEKLQDKIFFSIESKRKQPLGKQSHSTQPKMN